MTMRSKCPKGEQAEERMEEEGSDWLVERFMFADVGVGMDDCVVSTRYLLFNII